MSSPSGRPEPETEERLEAAEAFCAARSMESSLVRRLTCGVSELELLAVTQEEMNSRQPPALSRVQSEVQLPSRVLGV